MLPSHAFLAIGLVLIASIEKISSHNDYDEEAWSKAGEYLSKYMDQTKEPCQDFYNHVCANYGPHNDSKNELSPHKDVYRILAEGLDQLDLTSEKSTDSEKALKIFYDQCKVAESNLIESSNKSTTEMVSFLRSTEMNEVKGGEKSGDIWLYLGTLKRQFGLDFFIQVITERKHLRDGSTLAIMPGFMLNSTEDLEIDFMDNQVTRIRLSELPAFLPEIDWQSYFDGLLPDTQFHVGSSQVQVDVFFPTVLKHFSSSINRVDIEIITGLAKIMISGKETEFNSKAVKYGAHPCLIAAMQYLSPAASKFYFKLLDRDVSEIGHDLAAIQRNVVSAFRFLLNSVEWLDGSDKEKIHGKLDHLKLVPAVPNWIDNETKVLEETAIYRFDSNLSLSKNRQNFEEINLDRGLKYALLLSDDEIKMPVFDSDFNIHYFPMNNAINIPLEFMTQPRYDIRYPLALKYGAIGTVVGHELMHAFDQNSFPMNFHGAPEWISEKAKEEFEKKTSCLIRQYSSYCNKEHQACVSGTKTFSENMADIDGIKIAYTAFKFATQVYGNDPPILSMFNYTNDQLFFIASARNWCSTELRNLDMLRVNDPVHSPDRARVEMTMPNVPVFARAFQCPVGSTYAPLKVCTVWGDLANPARKRK